MKLQLIEGRMETTMPHHSQIVCRKTGDDEWVVDKVLEGLAEEFGDTYVQILVNAALAKVYRQEAAG